MLNQDRTLNRSETWRCLSVVNILILAAIVSCIALSQANAGQLDVGFDHAGFRRLYFNGENLLTDGALKVTRVVFADGYRDRRNEPPSVAYGGEHRAFSEGDVSVRESFIIEETNAVTQIFHWGELTAVYQQNDNNLDIRVEISNASDKVIELIEFDLVELELPDAPQVDRVSSMMRYHSNTNIGGYDVRRARFGDTQIVYVSTIPNQPLRQHFTPNDNNLKLTVSAGHERGGREVYHGVWNSMPIRPEEKDTYRLSIRFAEQEYDTFEMVEDIWRAFGEAFPQTFIWQDRSPLRERSKSAMK